MVTLIVGLLRERRPIVTVKTMSGLHATVSALSLASKVDISLAAGLTIDLYRCMAQPIVTYLDMFV